MSENSDKRLRNLRSLSIYKKIEKIWIILLREWRKQFIIKNHDVSPLKKIARTHTQWQRLRELKEAINHPGKKISVCVCIHHWEKYKRHDEWIYRHTTEAFLWRPHWKACDVIWNFFFPFILIFDICTWRKVNTIMWGGKIIGEKNNVNTLYSWLRAIFWKEMEESYNFGLQFIMLKKVYCVFFFSPFFLFLSTTVKFWSVYNLTFIGYCLNVSF